MDFPKKNYHQFRTFNFNYKSPSLQRPLDCNGREIWFDYGSVNALDINMDYSHMHIDVKNVKPGLKSQNLKPIYSVVPLFHPIYSAIPYSDVYIYPRIKFRSIYHYISNVFNRGWGYKKSIRSEELVYNDGKLMGLNCKKPTALKYAARIYGKYATYEHLSNLYAGKDVENNLSITNSKDSNTMFRVFGYDGSSLSIDSILLDDDSSFFRSSFIKELSFDSRITGVKSLNLHNVDWCYLKFSDKKCRILCNDDDVWSCNGLELFDHDLLSICPSPFTPAEFIVITDDGKMRICTGNNLNCQQVSCDLDQRFYNHECWWKCYFGGHPRQVIVTDLTGLSVYDMRKKVPQSQDIFALPHTKLNSKERIRIASPHPKNDFHHVVATDWKMLLFDMRFPNNIVLNWNHGLRSCPKFCTLIQNDLSKDSFAFITADESTETHYFPFNLQKNDAAPCFQEAPFKLDKVKDPLSLDIHVSTDIPFTLLRNRLSTCIVGTSAISNKQDGFYFFQSNGWGDVFYQNFQTHDCIDNQECSLGHKKYFSDRYKLEWKEWINNLKEQMFSKLPKDGLFSSNHFGKHQFLVDSEKYYDLIAKKEYAHVLCQLCMPKLQKNSNVENVDTGFCASCRKALCDSSFFVESSLGDHIYKFTRKDTELVDHLNIDDYKDADSLIIHKLWFDDKSDFDVLLQQRDDECIEYRQELAAKYKIVSKTDVDDKEKDINNSLTMKDSSSLNFNPNNSISSCNNSSQSHGFSSTPPRLKKKTELDQSNQTLNISFSPDITSYKKPNLKKKYKLGF